jgi:hypothetical protein
MNIIEFLRTIYLGDRSCRSILIDGWNSELKLQVSCISRVRSKTWNYYTDEDIEDGHMVFGNVSFISFDPQGFLPDDLINSIEAHVIDQQSGTCEVKLSIDSVDSKGFRTEVVVTIHADTLSLETNDAPAVRITS